MARRAQPLWDLPTRIFHWTIVCCVSLAWWSAEAENYDLHQWLGYTVIVLVISRFIWGILGSRHSRFTDFLVGPGKLWAYLRGRGSASVGHNPLGGWSVLALLLLLLTQAGSGLFNTDEILFSGPLSAWADTSFREAMGEVHEVAFNVLLGFIGLHVLAVFYYQLRLKQPLLQAMIKGSAPNREGQLAPAPWWQALAILIVVALCLWWGLQQVPQAAAVIW